MGKFRDWLKDQAETTPSDQERAETIGEWISTVNGLYGLVTSWLRQEDPEGILKIARGMQAVEEEELGPYQAPTLTLHLGSKRVLLRPVARHVIGSLGRFQSPGLRPAGRVDMTDRHGLETHMLYRVAGTGETATWAMVDSETYVAKQLDKHLFEEALQDLLS